MAPKKKALKKKEIKKPGRGGARAGAGRKAKDAPVVTPPALKEVIPETPAVLTPDAEGIFRELPLRQQNFIVNYLGNGFNGTKAAIDAGFSAKTADSQASRLLKNAKVKAVISARTKKSLAKRELTAQLVLDEIAKLAFHDPRNFYNEDGSLKKISELDDDCAASLAGVDLLKMKYKHADKGANLERLGRYFKLFTDRSESDVNVKITTVVVQDAIKEPRKLPPSKPDF